MRGIPGPGAKNTIKNSLEFVKCMSGEIKPKKKRKKPVRVKATNDMVEKHEERTIIHALKRMGYWVYKTGSAGAYDYNMQYNESGIADLIVLGKPNGVVFMEVKPAHKRRLKNGGLTGKQPQFRDVCGVAGVKYCIVYSVREAVEAVTL